MEAYKQSCYLANITGYNRMEYHDKHGNIPDDYGCTAFA
jgi:hypothetical protein